jgi:uncharacterized protein (TIGR02246 family)
MKHRRILCCVVCLLVTCILPAQHAKIAGSDDVPKKNAPGKDDPAHDELRQLKQALVDAFNKKDVEGLVKNVHPEAVITWQNGEVSRGPDGIRNYNKRVLEGDKSYLTKVQADPEVTDLSVLIGDPPTTAVAYGKLHDVYTLRDGGELAMDSLFSATCVKQDGRWVIVSFHGSTNVFDNGVINVAVKKTMWWTGGIAGGGALLLGFIGGWLLGRRKAG